MRAEGLEPPRSFDHEDLNLARLPMLPPRPRAFQVYGVDASEMRPGIGGTRPCEKQIAVNGKASVAILENVVGPKR
jgi:hypothetical protein